MTTSDQSPEQDKKISIGDVHTEGGDFVGQDKVGGDKISGDKVGGGKVEIGTVSDSKDVLIAGGDIHITQNISQPPVSPSEATREEGISQAQKAADKGFPLSGKLFGILVGIATIMACIAAAAVVPEVRQFLGLDGGRYSYVVRVQSSGTGDAIQDAKVIIEVTGSSSLIGYTDSNGYWRLSIPNSYRGKPARLIIEAVGYQTQRAEIDLYADQLPAMMLMKSVSAPETVVASEAPTIVLETTPPFPSQTTPPPGPESPVISPTTELPISTPNPPSNISPIDGMALVKIPAGEFLRGLSNTDSEKLNSMCNLCQTDLLDDASPQRTIYLDEYQIDKTEVTNNQFELFVKQTGWATTAEENGYSYVIFKGNKAFSEISGANWRNPTGPGSSITGKGEFPVTQISWNDANSYCRWAKRRLPTEAEWEKAARGPDGLLFPWGDQQPNNTLLNYNSVNDGPVKVGSYLAGASPYGALDMSGNLWEWVADFYDQTYFIIAPERDPLGPTTGEGHVMRGGSWASNPLDKELAFITSIYRQWNKSTISSNVLGFRCAQSP
jgi:formylglycine-generating enzyme required for sulfatase activity